MWPPQSRREMGAPVGLSTKAQAAMGVVIAKAARRLLDNFEFEKQRGATLIRREPIGVCGFITPWNWPVNQIALKVLPALAAGCTMVLKPSEIAPFSGAIFAEVMQAAGGPGGSLQPRQRRRSGRWTGHCRPPGHRHGVVHRLHPRRHRGGGHGGGHGQAL